MLSRSSLLPITPPSSWAPTWTSHAISRSPSRWNKPGETGGAVPGNHQAALGASEHLRGSRHLSERIRARRRSQSLERTLVSVGSVQRWLHQFFFDPTGVLAPEAAVGYEAIELPGLSSVVWRAIIFFNVPYPASRKNGNTR